MTLLPPTPPEVLAPGLVLHRGWFDRSAQSELVETLRVALGLFLKLLMALADGAHLTAGADDQHNNGWDSKDPDRDPKVLVGCHVSILPPPPRIGRRAGEEGIISAWPRSIPATL